jgi:hypothetical protein
MTRHERTASQEELIKQALQEPTVRLKSVILEMCQRDDELGVAAIIDVLRTDAPVVLYRLGVK